MLGMHAGVPDEPGAPFEPSPGDPSLPAPLPADAGISVAPGVTIRLGASHNHTFTVTANGPATSEAVSVLILLPGYQQIGYKSVGMVANTPSGKLRSGH